MAERGADGPEEAMRPDDWGRPSGEGERGPAATPPAAEGDDRGRTPARHEEATMDEQLAVRSLMDAAPYSIGDDESVLMAWEVMERSEQCQLPVVRADGCCAGVLDRAEVAVACAAAAAPLSRSRVRELVHARRTVTVHPEESVLRAAAVMTEEHLDALPVTDARGRLVGLLTARHYVAAAAGLHTRTESDGRHPARAALDGLPPRRAAQARGIVIP
ncbi:HPP family protein [Streptomyces sp. NPDC001852]|uniref:CBS domain-containing protein n=1 Tax=Streptomyces sp. NPDC001852 TaxID=3364619 RepID=UPI0036C58E19